MSDTQPLWTSRASVYVWRCGRCGSAAQDEIDTNKLLRFAREHACTPEPFNRTVIGAHEPSRRRYVAGQRRRPGYQEATR